MIILIHIFYLIFIFIFLNTYLAFFFLDEYTRQRKAIICMNFKCYSLEIQLSKKKMHVTLSQLRRIKQVFSIVHIEQWEQFLIVNRKKFKLNYIISVIINYLRISETAYIYNLIWHLSFAHDSTGNTIFLSSLTMQVSSFLSWYSFFF